MVYRDVVKVDTKLTLDTTTSWGTGIYKYTSTGTPSEYILYVSTKESCILYKRAGFINKDGYYRVATQYLHDGDIVDISTVGLKTIKLTRSVSIN